MTVNQRALGLGQNRADAVRQRRARKTRTIERAGRIETPRPKRKRTLRRRYSVTLPAERGAEIQFTAIPAGSVGTRLLSFVMIIFAIASLVRFGRSEQFKVNQVSVGGIEMLTQAQIRSMLGIEGLSLFYLDPRALAQDLEQEAEIQSAGVTLGWPDRVELQIDERSPIVEWADAGRTWWLSTDGVAYVQHGEQHGLIKVSSEQESLLVQEDPQLPVVDPGLITAAVSLSNDLPDVENWIFDIEHGLGFEDGRGWRAFFGTGGDMSMKVRIYHSIADALSAEGIRATLVSVENPNAPYYAVR